MAHPKSDPPPYSATDRLRRPRVPRRLSRLLRAACAVAATLLLLGHFVHWQTIFRPAPGSDTPTRLSIERLRRGLQTCEKLRSKPTDPIGLGRDKNGRWLGGKATLIRNATVWVGEPVEGTSDEDARLGKGYGWWQTDVLLNKGLITHIGPVIPLPPVFDTYDADGRPLTAGIIDMHSHTGVSPLPGLDMTDDTNEMSSPTTPYVRSIDGLDPLDPQIQVIKSGGVTMSLILPGSGNNIGGEAYVIKHAVGEKDGRVEISALDMLADPERNWRYMKMACGENAKRVYGRVGEQGPVSRMGESWWFRKAFESARKLVRDQDDWCDAAEAGGVENMATYLPEDLQWESLGAVLRGQVHVNVHCYTVRDLEAYVDHTNEFEFPLRAFHHAHETFIVPEILKRAWGGRPPASALFADNMFYKAEASRGSEYAGKILWENGLTPVYVSDNPVLNAQHVLLEAAKAYRYGLPYHVALAGVTSAPAELLGMGERTGKVKAGFDADVVVWDSDPLSLGAAPAQVWIDGTAQFEEPVVLEKPRAVIVPDEELRKDKPGARTVENAVFTGVSKVMLPGEEATGDGQQQNVVISDGEISCIGDCSMQVEAASKAGTVVALKNGYLTTSFVAFGSTIGLNAIDAERDTDNGPNRNTFSRAVDGLLLDTQKLRVAHEYGITKAISAPKLSGGMTHHGTSVGFLTAAKTPMEEGAVWAIDVAVHYTLGLSAKHDPTPSISSAVGALRTKLLKAASTTDTPAAYSEESYLAKAITGELPLVLTVHSADTISAILNMKTQVESTTVATTSSPPDLRLIILGGAESHLVAAHLAAANVSVVLAPFQSYANSWDQRRSLPGAPLTNGTAIDVLLDAGVKVGIGLEEDWLVRDLGILAGIAYANGQGRVSERGALDLVGGNILDMLGVTRPRGGGGHFVVWEGSPLDIGGRVRAVGTGTGRVDVY